MDIEIAMREDARNPQPGMSGADEFRMARAAAPKQEFDDDVKVLKDNIRRALKTRTVLMMENDFHIIYSGAIGSARGTHLTKAWDALTDEGVTQPRPKNKPHDWAKIYRANGGPAFK